MHTVGDGKCRGGGENEAVVGGAYTHSTAVDRKPRAADGEGTRAGGFAGRFDQEDACVCIYVCIHMI